MIYPFFKRNDVQSRSIGPSDLLKIELRSDSVKLFDQAWEETLMGMGKEREKDPSPLLHGKVFTGVIRKSRVS